MGYVPTICLRPKLNKANTAVKLTKEEKLKRLMISEKAAWDRSLIYLARYYQNKIKKIEKL